MPIGAAALALALQSLCSKSDVKSSEKATDPSASPNFVIILVDDMGWRDLSSYGSNYFENPHIGRLASKDMKFFNAYAACPFCSPTRASIMTGKYPARFHLTDWIKSFDFPKAN